MSHYQRINRNKPLETWKRLGNHDFNGIFTCKSHKRIISERSLAFAENKAAHIRKLDNIDTKEQKLS